MKAIKIAKFQIFDTLKPILIYYSIFITVIIILIFSSLAADGNFSSSGLEMATAIFLFVVGLNSFKDNFKFSQVNNVSRITFFKGLIISIFPVAIFMALMDITLNRLYNIFVHCPMNFDMIYGSMQSNPIYTIIQTLIWIFSAYSTIIITGILISLVYYKSSTLIKVIISVLPFVLITTALNILPVSFWHKIGAFISFAFGWESKNPFMGVISFAVISLILIIIVFLLVRKVILKR
jgi:hypothetical protein